VARDFRGSRYIIEFHNPQHVNHGIQDIIIDGQKLDGNILPVFENKSEVRVEVTLG